MLARRGGIRSIGVLEIMTCKLPSGASAPANAQGHSGHGELVFWKLNGASASTYFGPKDGRQRMGDTGVTDENWKFQIPNLRLGECKTTSGERQAELGRRGGGALGFFQVAKKSSAGSTAAR